MGPKPTINSVVEATAKYPRPKILLVDVPEAQDALEAEGYNVSTGSFGAPYKVPLSDQSLPVIPNGKLSNFAEQEIVVVNLLPPTLLDGPTGKKTVSDGERDVWAICSQGGNRSETPSDGGLAPQRQENLVQRWSVHCFRRRQASAGSLYRENPWIFMA